MFRSFGLNQKNQKFKAAPAGLLRFAAVGKWMKLASLKQHPFLFRPPLRFVSRPSAEAGPSFPASADFVLKDGSFPIRRNLPFGIERTFPKWIFLPASADCFNGTDSSA